MSTHTMEWLFERAISWESAARDLYAMMAHWFPQDPSVSSFWQELSGDESRHAKFLHETRARLSGDQLGTPLGPKALEIARQVEALLTRIRVEELVTLDDAYELAHELESSEINLVFRMLTVELLLAEPERQDFLLTQVNDHLERFERFSQKFKKIDRRMIPIRRVALRPG
jgi:rubrerythrin